MTVEPMGALLGIRGIDVLVDGAVAGQIRAGEAREFAVAPGSHGVELELQGIVRRRSNRVEVSVPADGAVSVAGRYSRLWGKLQLALA